MSVESHLLTRNDLWSLEEYSERRADFRGEVLAHKQSRRVLLGPNILLVFENRLTIRYQIQEMLRIEKVFESAGIQEELDAYNPLMPDGDNWKCTMLIQYPDVAERRQKLQQLRGVEHKVWVRIGDAAEATTFAIADEDLERSNEDKTSAVHFLRFQLTDQLINAVKEGASIIFGIDHPQYVNEQEAVSESIRASLMGDLS